VATGWGASVYFVNHGTSTCHYKSKQNVHHKQKCRLFAKPSANFALLCMRAKKIFYNENDKIGPMVIIVIIISASAPMMRDSLSDRRNTPDCEFDVIVDNLHYEN
jgi:hypothetical protein